MLLLLLQPLLLLAGSVGGSLYSDRQKIQEQSSDYWFGLAADDIEEAINRPRNMATAKNVILFLGDGLGISTMTAGRIFKGQQQGMSGEETFLTFDRLPNMGLLKTYNTDKQVPDSAATATAYLCGVKANYETLGLKSSAKRNDCPASLKRDNRAQSILKWAQDSNKETGIVTTTRITHATPAAAYAHSAHRNWECDAKIKAEEDPDAMRCKDIALQLLEDSPGRDLKVILAGGRQPLGAQFSNSNSSSCKRADGRNLVTEWQQERQAEGASYAYVTNTAQLEAVDMNRTDCVMGLFAEGHMAYERERDSGPVGQPSLKQMTLAAIRRLSRAEDGYVLLIEGGRIDHALHNGQPQTALGEVVAFDEAIAAAMEILDLRDTLVLVTADHSHGLTINGYQDRGNDILGTSSYEKVTDGMEYTTLMFATGSGGNNTWDGSKVSRRNVSGLDTHDPDFVFPSLLHTEPGWSMHSGEDVAVFATGPWAHLFHRVHEQSYVAHVIAYSAAIGPYNDRRNVALAATNVAAPSGGAATGCVISAMFVLLLSYTIFLAVIE